jgi:hypothetical protein
MQNPLSFIDPMGRGATAGSRRNKAEGGDFSRFVFALPERLSARIGPGTAGLPLLIRILDAVTAKSGK